MQIGISFFRAVAIVGWMALLLANGKLQATHIVGGDLTYKHIINDSFEITLILYVDCVNGLPAAIAQDTDAMVGIFDSAGQYLANLLVFRSLPVRISSVNYDCVAPPTNACVDRYTYKYYTKLPFRQGGYILAFQRCCRNTTLNNIVNPLATGATYWTYVPDKIWSMGYNSSAVFNVLPPNFLCVNRMFSYDHSASDADGDSLAYELYAPYNGGNQSQSLPRPPLSPPYQTVIWGTNFGVNKMMAGSPELSIDPFTGLLTVKPKFLGQFVVGILVREFRNGVNISTTRRDFQFNVLNCQISVVGAFTQDIKSCGDTVHFTNQSLGADSFFWDFGDTSVSTDTSSQFAPSFVYGGAGIYNVRLWVSKGNCKDSAQATVTIGKDVERFAGNDTTICKGDSVRLGPVSASNFKYQWSPSDHLSDSSVARPLCTTPVSIRYIVSRKSDICSNTDTIDVEVKVINAAFTTSFQNECRFALLHIDSPGQANGISWKLDGMTIGAEELQTKKFNYYDEHQLQMTVTDSVCRDSAIQALLPKPKATDFYIPNVFTPNGDQVNECYRIPGVQLQPGCSRIWIYNRWGEKVFDSDKDGECWNGKNAGKDISEGSYFFVLDHFGKNYQGHIRVLR